MPLRVSGFSQKHSRGSAPAPLRFYNHLFVARKNLFPSFKIPQIQSAGERLSKLKICCDKMLWKFFRFTEFSDKLNSINKTKFQSSLHIFIESRSFLIASSAF